MPTFPACIPLPLNNGISQLALSNWLFDKRSKVMPQPDKSMLVCDDDGKDYVVLINANEMLVAYRVARLRKVTDELDVTERVQIKESLHAHLVRVRHAVAERLAEITTKQPKR